MILEQKLEIVDIGGSIIIHTFGAYFGLAVSRVVSPKPSYTSSNNSSVYHSDLFAMIGTIFLWIMWPSFNSALATSYGLQERTIINTVLALLGSCVTAFVMSQFIRPGHHFDMVDIQNATIAGGVAIGTASSMNIWPVGAIGIGVVASLISCLGYRYATPALQHFIGLHDTCGVHNLHGMPGILGGLAGVVAAATATASGYGTQLSVVFPARLEGRGASAQASLQLAAIGITLGMAVVGGLLTGLLMLLPIFVPVKAEDKGPFFTDRKWWHLPPWNADLEVDEPPADAELKP
eukprot:TRINITY_DN79_c0_g1_i4.p1 TRINITY_DN79_c0_g1~~TRINITY_DN79_c0_g1_i4.p1  ORF type:complete len:337 (+),score=84.52 TRINITY_DN79_c0_g1_i4:137-1012(+)